MNKERPGLDYSVPEVLDAEAPESSSKKKKSKKTALKAGRTLGAAFRPKKSSQIDEEPKDFFTKNKVKEETKDHLEKITAEDEHQAEDQFEISEITDNDKKPETIETTKPEGSLPLYEEVDLEILWSPNDVPAEAVELDQETEILTDDEAVIFTGSTKSNNLLITETPNVGSSAEAEQAVASSPVDEATPLPTLEYLAESNQEPPAVPPLSEVGSVNAMRQELNNRRGRMDIEGGGGGINPNASREHRKSDQALLSAELNGEQRGVLFGFLFANLWQRRQRKKLEKRLNKTITQESTRTTGLDKRQNLTTNELERLKQNQEVYRRQTGHELASRPTTLEVMNIAGKQRTEPVIISREFQKLPPEAKDIYERLQQLPEGHHLEQSAWHSIEMSQKTGRPVEKPVFEYGKEFQREKHQEVYLPAGDEIAVASGQVAVGGSTSVNIAGGSSSKPMVASVINGIDRLESTIRENRPLAEGVNNAALWTLFLLIVIAILLAIFA